MTWIGLHLTPFCRPARPFSALLVRANGADDCGRPRSVEVVKCAHCCVRACSTWAHFHRLDEGSYPSTEGKFPRAQHGFLNRRRRFESFRGRKKISQCGRVRVACVGEHDRVRVRGREDAPPLRAEHRCRLACRRWVGCRFAVAWRCLRPYQQVMRLRGGRAVGSSGRELGRVPATSGPGDAQRWQGPSSPRRERPSSGPVRT